MNVNINQIIVSFLRRVGVVSLPGVGSFTLKRDAAVFEDKRSILNASSYKLSYTESALLGDELIQEIALKNNLSEQNAKDTLYSYINQLLHQLESKGEMYISNLGKIVNENDSRIFTQDENSIFSKINFGLPNIALTPIVRNREEKISLIEKLREQNDNVIVPASIPIVEEEKSNYNIFGSIKDWIIAVLLACLILCLFNSYKSCNSNKNLKNGTTTVLLDSSTSHFIDTNLEQNENVIIDSLIADNVEPDLPIKCIIITGSFTKSRNAIRMQDKIVSLGYDPYIARHNNFDRVGIIFNCKGVDLVSYINEIREEFNIESWYLEPQLVVPHK